MEQMPAEVAASVRREDCPAVSPKSRASAEAEAGLPASGSSSFRLRSLR